MSEATNNSTAIQVESAINLTESDKSVVVVSGEVDIANAPKLHERLQGAFSASNLVTVDLSGVSFIDSTGLGVLVNAKQKARSTGQTLKLILPEGRARFPFEVTGLASMFEDEG